MQLVCFYFSYMSLFYKEISSLLRTYEPEAVFSQALLQKDLESVGVFLPFQAVGSRTPIKRLQMPHSHFAVLLSP